MAPTPTAGKNTGGAPRTPTKLGRKPQSSQTPKLGEQGQKASSAASTPAQGAKQGAQQAQGTAQGATQQAQQAGQKAPGPAGDAAGKAGDAAQGAQQQAGKAAEDAGDKAEGVPEEASKVEMKDDEEGEGDDDDEGPLSKVSQAKDDAQGKADEATEDVKDTAGGAQKEAEGAAQEAGEEGDDDDDAEEGDDDNDDNDDDDDIADDTTEKAGDVAEGAEDDAEEGEQSGSGALAGAKNLAGKAQGLAGKAGDAAKDPKQAAGKAQEAAGDVAEGAQDTAEGAVGDAQKVAGDAGDQAEDAAEGAKDTAEDAAEGAKDTAEDTAEGAKDTAEDAAEGAQDQAESAKDTAEEGAEGAQDQAEGATGQDLPDMSELPLDLSVLKGLEVQEDGTVQGPDGPVGRLVEGDAEDLAGYPIGDDGEILDDDGDLVGRCELLPDAAKKQLQEMKDKGELPEGAEKYLDQLPDTDDVEDAGDDLQLPGTDILKGYTCGIDGLVYNDDGDTIGRVVDGDPDELQHATLNEHGEFIDDNGNVVGHAEVHEEAANLGYDIPSQDDAEDAQDQLPDGEEATEGIEDQLPGVEALEGKELNEAGEIHDADGNLLGDASDELKEKLESGELNADDLKINEDGEVVDADGNVLGTVGLAEGAAEKLKEATGPATLDIRILEGRKVNKKGKILDDDGEEIGELKEGDPKECQGKKVNDKGEVLDKNGNVIGKVGVVPGEAAETATHDLLEELGELPEEGEDNAEEEGEQEEEDDRPRFKVPGIDTLEGLKVNKKGKVLDEDGEEIGELVQGEVADCAGKKINEKGEVLDADGNVIGMVRTIATQLTEEEIADGVEGIAAEDADAAHEAAANAEDAEEGAEDAKDDAEQAAEEAQDAAEDAEDAGPQLPPLSILEGLTCNKSGKLIDSNGNTVGELTEGDAKKLSKAGVQCDAEGQFWDNKGKVIGRAQTVPQEEAEEEAPFAGLDGLVVVKDGYVEDENENKVGIVVEGDAKKLVGRHVDEDGDILDKKGTVVGHAERWEEPEEEQIEEEVMDYSILEGKPLNKAGMVIGDNGVPVGRLVQGSAKELAGKKVADEGKIYNDSGKVIGQCEVIPPEEREAKPEGPFAGLEGLRVIAGGKVADENENVVGEIVEGNPKRLIGLAVDEDGDIVDKNGTVKGHAEPIPEEEDADLSVLDGKMLNKQGYVVDEQNLPIGKLVEGDAKNLAGKRCDEQGLLYNDRGKVAGRCEVLPDSERPSKAEGPFGGYEGLHVNKEGYVEDAEGNVVGVITEGNAKKLVGMQVDEDGDIIDKYGNTKGHAEPYEEEEQTPEDLSALAGCTVNKAGNVVDSNGTIIGRVAEGDVQTMIGKKVDGQGQIWDNAGQVVGRAELAKGQDTSAEGPFAGFEDAQVSKDGTVVTPAGDIIGRVTEGDIKKLVAHKVDESGDILDKNGNVIGRAERWEPEEKERRINPMSGRKVNREGEVRSEDGDVMGRLTAGDLGHCVGCEIDDNGNVVDNDGNKIGEVTLLENIVEEEVPEDETEEERIKREEREVAKKMGNICSQTLERVQPVCKQITEHIEKADRTPREELDEDQLVNDVKPLIEEGGRILQECNGSLRGLDPDGHIAAQAKGRAGSGEASPEEVRLAETLKELTTTVVTTIDNAKKRISDMPHAKKKLNPLWGLMTQPLFQILAAVGLLLAGVLGLVGQLLNGLGLGGLVNGLLGGLGIDKLMGGLGLGGLFGGDDKKKKKSGGGASSLPIIGGLMGGK
ncbi:hypothetical protein MBLNU457_7729t2 [Dothideomycetes sp. NU457]